MKYLVNYKAGKVISEQEQPSETISEQVFTYTKGGEDEKEIISTKDKEYLRVLAKPLQWNQYYEYLDMSPIYNNKTKRGEEDGRTN